MSRPRVIDRDMGYKDFLRRMKALNGKPHVKVGFLADKKEERDGASGPTNVEVAAANEFGTKRIPARPFIRSTFSAHQGEYERLGEKLSRAVVDGKMSLATALGLLGEKAAADIKQTVTQGAGVPPPNAPATVKHKGHDRTLIGGDAKKNQAGGQMIGAVTWALAGTKG